MAYIPDIIVDRYEAPGSKTISRRSRFRVGLFENLENFIERVVQLGGIGDIHSEPGVGVGPRNDMAV